MRAELRGATGALTLLLAACGPAVAITADPEKTSTDPGESADDTSSSTTTDPDADALPPVAVIGEGVQVLQPKASWTFLVFMNGDNDLEEAGLGDLNEMEQAGSTDAVNILVQFDRSASYTRADGNWTGARRYRVSQDSNSDQIASEMVEDLGSVDSGDPDTVVDFVSWAAENYPAEHYAMVFWDHGWGWSLTTDKHAGGTKGVSWDEDTNNDISVAEGDLEDVLSRSTDALGQSFDLVGFDACVMGSWEVAYVTQPYAKVFVASQDYESEDGWAYDTTLADLVADPEMSAADLGDSIAERFSETKDSTQSAIDLTTLPALNESLDALAQAMLADADPDALLSAGATDAQEFEGGGHGTDHDLANFLDLLSTSTTNAEVKTLALDSATTLNGAIIANYTYGRGVADAHGLSIYTPTRGHVDSTYLKGRWATETSWDDLLVAARGSR